MTVEGGPTTDEPADPEGADGRPARTAATRHGRRPGPLRRHPWRVAAVVVILAGLCLIVGVFLWVRAEADPSGPLGRQVVVNVAPNADEGTVISTLADRGVVGSSLAWRVWSQFNHLPSIQAGTYAFDQNSSFSRVRTVLEAGPNVFFFSIPPGFTVHEVAERVGQIPGFTEKGFDALATSGVVHSPWQPVGATSLEGLLGTGNYRVVPGETERALGRHGRPLRRAGRWGRPGRRVGPTRLHALPSGDHCLDRRKGRGHQGQSRSGGPGHLQPPGCRNVAADELDRPLRRGTGRRPGDVGRPGQANPLQHVSEPGPDPHTRSASRAGRPWPLPSIRPPDPGSTSWW